MTPQEDSIAKELFKTYKVSLINYCIRKYEYSNEDAEDLVAETFCRLSNNIHRITDRLPAEQRSWLFKTLINVISEHNRKKQHIVKIDSAIFEPLVLSKDEPEQIIEEITYDKLINDIKNKLRDKEKLYFERFINGEYNYKEIAKSEKVNYNTFKSQMLRLSPKVRKIALEILEKHKLSLNNVRETKSPEP